MGLTVCIIWQSFLFTVTYCYKVWKGPEHPMGSMGAVSGFVLCRLLRVVLMCWLFCAETVLRWVCCVGLCCCVAADTAATCPLRTFMSATT